MEVLLRISYHLIFVSSSDRIIPDIDNGAFWCFSVLTLMANGYDVTSSCAYLYCDLSLWESPEVPYALNCTVQYSLWYLPMLVTRYLFFRLNL